MICEGSIYGTPFKELFSRCRADYQLNIRCFAQRVR
jgi:hypothetical protein